MEGGLGESWFVSWVLLRIEGCDWKIVGCAAEEDKTKVSASHSGLGSRPLVAGADRCGGYL